MRRSPHAADEQLLRQLLAESRKARGVTQQVLADRLAVKQSFVSKYETGERYLTVLEFVDVCEAIGTSPVSVLKRFVAQRAPLAGHKAKRG